MSVRRLHSDFSCAVLACIILWHVGIANIDMLELPILSAVLILALGVPHGALDIALLSHRRPHASFGDFVLLHAKYIGLAVLVAIGWWLASTLALGAFLVLAAYHFGGDWRAQSAHGSRLLVGAALLSSTTLLNEPEVTRIFGWLAPPPDASRLASGLRFIAPLLLAAVVIDIVRRGAVATRTTRELVAHLLAAIILPPITFFLLYFCLFHSVRHVFDAREELADQSVASLVRQAAPYATAACASTVLGSLVFSHLGAGPALLSAIFVALAALTVPHMLLVGEQR